MEKISANWDQLARFATWNFKMEISRFFHRPGVNLIFGSMLSATIWGVWSQQGQALGSANK